jgi:endoglucanase
MSHFVTKDNLNIFRLPVGWQYLVNNVLGGQLDATNSGKYDQLVQACLATGASCIVDIHNYARWDGGIIGQGGPSNAQFTNLWYVTRERKLPIETFCSGNMSLGIAS